MGFVVVRDIFKQRLFSLLSGWSIPQLANDCMNKNGKKVYRFVVLFLRWAWILLLADS